MGKPDDPFMQHDLKMLTRSVSQICLHLIGDLEQVFFM